MEMSATTISDRLEILAGPQPRKSASFADEVRLGLSAPSKHLASKYFYDELGSALFDAITVLPEYYLTRAETEILREWGWEIVRAIGNPMDFVELGSGSAVKTRILIDEALRVQRTLRYCPIDISTEALRASAQSLVTAYAALKITAYAGDYFAVLGAGLLARSERILAMFMGSNIGNYEPAQARELLGGIARSLKKGDGLLLGVDLKKDPRVLQLAYDDPAGVTAAFNKNLLGRINRELGGNFDLHAFRHITLYDEEHGAVRSYLEARREHDVYIEALGFTAQFTKGERIHTESSYKYSLEDVGELAKAVGLQLQRSWLDRGRRFCVALLAPA
jgi:dimethylhistidine N-methyltransferase